MTEIDVNKQYKINTQSIRCMTCMGSLFSVDEEQLIRQLQNLMVRCNVTFYFLAITFAPRYQKKKNSSMRVRTAVPYLV